MTRPNRVLPDGSLAALPIRGGFMGNRGCLHRADGTIFKPHTPSYRAWIICTLREKPGRGPHPFPVPGRYTPLFFLDEAVALAAGHRPCAECRRAAYRAFGQAWEKAFGSTPKAAEMDHTIHEARHAPRPLIDAADLPTGAFFRHDSTDWRVDGASALPLLGQVYGPPQPLPRVPVTALTPLPTLRILQAGYRPALSPTEDRPNW